MPKLLTLAASLVACAAAAPAFAQPGTADPLTVTAPDAHVRTVRISYDEADLLAGRGLLDGRIRRAVGKVCGAPERALNDQSDRVACRGAAMASANRQLQLALAAGRTSGVIVLAAR